MRNKLYMTLSIFFAVVGQKKLLYHVIILLLSSLSGKRFLLTSENHGTQCTIDFHSFWIKTYDCWSQCFTYAGWHVCLQCSQSCGHGIQQRSVQCHHLGLVVSTDECNPAERPLYQRSCFSSNCQDEFYWVPGEWQDVRICHIMAVVYVANFCWK